ncbi:hypothetical protein [Streptomyces sp. V2I9]|uniref:hypothetical protein n=1 Tax=Streptomyces sp. V2I9 TaxID=3042304 RepID=UPI00277DB46E|nr:hypothetical protein [Streptomyces sp. V2I9]MDQ0984278.1 hypothetical protein [Streptomyces sp. V2I9]
MPDGKRNVVAQIEQQDDDGAWSHYGGGALVDSRELATAAHRAEFVVRGKVKTSTWMGPLRFGSLSPRPSHGRGDDLESAREVPA